MKRTISIDHVESGIHEILEKKVIFFFVSYYSFDNVACRRTSAILDALFGRLHIINSSPARMIYPVIVTWISFTTVSTSSTTVPTSSTNFNISPFQCKRFTLPWLTHAADTWIEACKFCVLISWTISRPSPAPLNMCIKSFMTIKTEVFWSL